MDIDIASIVVSIAGHDRHQPFFVMKLDDTYVYLADGKGRKVEKPKRKKRKHVQFLVKTDSRIADKIRNGEKVLNSELRRELAEFGQKTVITKGVN